MGMLLDMFETNERLSKKVASQKEKIFEQEEIIKDLTKQVKIQRSRADWNQQTLYEYLRKLPPGGIDGD